MKIERIIDLWNQSKYETLIIKGLPCINSEKEITWGTGIYRKGQIILNAGEHKVEDYLKDIYKDSIFIFERVLDDDLVFRRII